jgi:STE24 endopeptidase
MKLWAFILLAVYVLERLFDHFLDLLSLRYMKKQKKVPAEFSGFIDDALYEKTRSYTADKTVFGMAEKGFGEIVLAVFIYCGIMDLFNSWLFGFRLDFIWNGIIFFIILASAQTVLNIPFDLYSTFKIEKKYGFNTMKPGLWVSDLIKSFLMQTFLLGLLALAGLALVRWSPDGWWLLLWGAFSLFNLFMMVISPYVIEPLFNKYTPLEGELAEKIKAVLSKTGISVERVFKMDASKRSRHSNAYFTGIGRVKRIVLFDTLIEQFTHEEILSVLAHEAGHWKKKHVLKRVVSTFAVSLAVFYLAWAVIRSGYLTGFFGVNVPTFYANAVLFGFAIGLVSFFFSPVSAWFSRRDEAQADRYAVELMGGGGHMIGALKKLVKENLSNLYPHPLAAFIRYSHPPVLERIEKIRKMGTPGI